MALSFPSSPNPGDKYPVPSVPGLPTYTWDGEKWTTVSSPGLHVAKTGDVMTGDLTLKEAQPTLHLVKTTATNQVNIYGYNAAGGTNLVRWLLQLGDQSTEPGLANVGSNFGIHRFTDAGAYLDAPIYINRADGKVVLTGDPVSPMQAATKGYVDTGTRFTVGISGPAYTLALADAGKVFWVSGATANTITIPSNTSVVFPVGTQIEFIQADIGQLSFVPGSGVSLMSEGSKRKTLANMSGVTLMKMGTDSWWLGGSLTA